MDWRRRWIMLLGMLLLCSSFPHTAHAGRAKVSWTSVDVRQGDDAKRVAKRLRYCLTDATKTEKWGKHKELKLKARVTELAWERREDVARVSLTVVARIEGGPSARSHIRMGGHPKERRKLERDALRIVANGLVTRLAELARARSDPERSGDD